MPSELATCPKCQKKLRVPENLVGKPVKCPTCSEVFTAQGEPHADLPPPAPEPETERGGPVARRLDDRDDDRPRPRDEDEEEVRPRRRRRFEDEDDDDDRPRRFRRRDFLPHRGTMILTFGILALVVFPIVFGPMAWIMGNNDLREIPAQGGWTQKAKDFTNAGRICGMIATLLFFVCCFGYIAFIGVMIGTGGFK